MHIVKGDNINEIQIALFDLLKLKGEKVLVRNLDTIEVSPVVLHLTNIKNRCTTLFERKWNIVFAVGEFTWHLNGSDELSYINYYSKNWQSISDNKGHIPESCYGAKMFNKSKNWINLISELRQDKYSRRAVINFYDSENTLGNNKSDVACTLSLQFLIRNNRLDLIVTMRSNDIIWGLPNDVFFFTLLQEYLANMLNVELGEYYHQIGSLHIYDRHLSILERTISNPEYFDFIMPSMSDVNHLDSFLVAETKMRKETINTINLESKFWQELLDILKLRSSNLDFSEKEKIIENSTYRKLLKLCPISYIRNKEEK